MHSCNPDKREKFAEGNRARRPKHEPSLPDATHREIPDLPDYPGELDKRDKRDKLGELDKRDKRITANV